MGLGVLTAAVAAALLRRVPQPPVLDPLGVRLGQAQTGLAMVASAGWSPARETSYLRDELLRQCKQAKRGQTKVEADNAHVLNLIRKVEMASLGQDTTGCLDGEWQLAWAGDDVTRSSPFFWAFRQAFPAQSDRIFAITDGLPPQFKRIARATQTITNAAGPGEGTLTSRVVVVALPDSPVPLQNHMITTSTVTGRGRTHLELRVQDTKVRDTTLPLLGDTPAFPSGNALEQVKQGASQVRMDTTYCDGTVRISKNPADGRYFVWRRV